MIFVAILAALGAALLSLFQADADGGARWAQSPPAPAKGVVLPEQRHLDEVRITLRPKANETGETKGANGMKNIQNMQNTPREIRENNILDLKRRIDRLTTGLMNFKKRLGF